MLKNTVIAFFSFNGIEHVTGAVKDFLKGKAEKEKVLEQVKDALKDIKK